MNKKRLEKLIDLKDVYKTSDLTIVEILDERVIIIKKANKEITAKSPNNYNLSDKINEIKPQLSSFKDNFEVEGFLLPDGKIVIHDVLSFGKLILSKLNYDERISLIEVLFSDKLLKPLTKKVKESSNYTSDQFEKYSVMTSNPNSSFYYDSNRFSRNIIISDFYYGNRIEGEREILFKCYQNSKGKPVYVGKTRIEDEKTRSTVVKMIQKNKRVIARVDIVFDKKKSKKFSKINFNRILRDEKFRNIVVDSELFFKPIIIFNRFGKTKTSYYMIKHQKSLNTLTGAI